jgi:hypothetical protein
MLTEIANVGFALQETTRRGREDDLPSVPGRCDPCRAMDVDSDVAFFGHLRLSGVDAHANADLAAAERLAGDGRGRDCVGCSREGDEEGVALGVDLDAVVLGERSSQRGAVFGEEIGVPGAVFLKEPGGAFDVREQKGDGAGREIFHSTNYCVAPWLCQGVRCAGEEPCRILEIISPAGFEHFFQEFSDMGGAINADPDELTALGERYGHYFKLESVPDLLERFGLRIGEPLCGSPWADTNTTPGRPLYSSKEGVS